jgi:kynurenine formamidase
VNESIKTVLRRSSNQLFRRSIWICNLSVFAFFLWLKCIEAEQLNLNQSRIIDLTYSFDENTVYWPSSPSKFELKPIKKGKTDQGYFYSAFSICAPEHGGTHLDAPIHFFETGWSVDKIPLTQLIGSAIVIDIRNQVEKDRDYRLSVLDIQNWEKKFGEIPQASIVLLRTGWSKFWPNLKSYLGDEKDVQKLHFPSFGEDAVQFLIKNRKIKAIGVDTASIDYGPSKDFPVHRLAGKKNIPGFENLAHLNELPVIGTNIIALPIKTLGGSGGPLRIIALVSAN